MNPLFVALSNAIAVADGLAEQQAMPDDWYVERLESARSVLNEYSVLSPKAPDMSGESTREDAMVNVGDAMAELLRGLIVWPMLRVQDAATLPTLVDEWRKAKAKE